MKDNNINPVAQKAAAIPVRSSGILLHPTSLPGPYGIGDLGPEAFAWVDALVKTKQGWWQMLPLAPTGYADSPYQCLSAFAGNPNLISPDKLVEDGLLRSSDLQGVNFPVNFVDFESGAVIQFKTGLLIKAWENFQSGAVPALKPLFDDFCNREASWLEDFSVFMALKEAHHLQSWLTWEPELRERQPVAMVLARKQLSGAIAQQKFRQFLFARQWGTLKTYANAHGIRLIGDVPIFVSADSADVWGNPQYFQLDERRQPLVVAGVPPDYFSATGQLWGNPLYNWEALRQDGYGWWVRRMQNVLKQMDVVRVDHFRGFEAYWEVPGGDSIAERGRWVKGPGYDLFDALVSELGDLAIIAEDLGVITSEVEALRTFYGFPGMRILQFAFAGAIEERFLPFNYDRNTVVYTGTHDNDTTRGWYRNAASDKDRAFMHRYMGTDGQDISWDMIRLAWASVAVLAVAPLQDVLDLGSEARMNLPGVASGYWRWRFRKDLLKEAILDRLGEMTSIYGRDKK
ncbi:MAG: 4-alpha-glucanotransferase [Omnitrophica WOR_2 bacterium]